MAIEVAPREALRNGTVLCKEMEDFVGNVSDKAPLKNVSDLALYLKKDTGLFGYKSAHMNQELAVLGMTGKMRDEGSLIAIVDHS